MIGRQPEAAEISREDERWDPVTVEFASVLVEWIDIYEKIYWEEAAVTKTWDLSEPHTLRYLSIDSEGKLVKICMRSKGLSGSIPDTIGSTDVATTLAVIDFSENALYGSIPESIAQCASLTHLTLFSNQLTGYVGDWIGYCTALQHVDLSYNQLEGSIPSGLSFCTDLRTLKLQFNAFSGDLPDLHACEKLEQLWVNDNQLTGIAAFVATGGELAQLRELYAFNNPLYRVDTNGVTKDLTKALKSKQGTKRCKIMLDAPPSTQQQ